MSDNKVTLDQLDNSAVEAMSSSVGDVSMLNTENKTIVGALAEIVGKKEIANAIGEPLAETDKFTEMSSEINGLLSTFKTNMMNAGVVVESGDKFKQLIEKIKGLTEGEGNKGIQFAEGTYGGGSFNAGKTISTANINFNTVLDFVPTILFLEFNDITYNSNTSSFRGLMSNITPNRFSITGPGNTIILITNVSNNGCTIGPESATTMVNTTCTINFPENRFFAIGVGEEDTSLRDSLADILENKGVDVTEEDDMASLISKVDSEFNEKNNSKVEIEFSFEDMVELQYKGLDSEGYGFTAKVLGIKTSAIDFKPSHMYVYSLQQPYQGYLWTNYNSMDDGTETMMCTNIGNWFDWTFINITFTHNQGYNDIIVEPNNFGIPVYQHGGGTATKPSTGYKFKLVAYK